MSNGTSPVDTSPANAVTQPATIASYRIERLLGIGSFATVWLGFDPDLDARVAIKVLAENWNHDIRVRERFLDEARLLWQLDDERLARVHALGELPDGRPYMVMAWAQGGSLRERLVAGRLPIRTSVLVLREIAAGVAVLHANRIVHRDLSPGNVLFRHPPRDPAPEALDAGEVLVADLGLAKAIAAASGLTARAGTPGFMAPEQDDPLAVVDVRADVFGLGRLGELLLAVPASGRPAGPARLRVGVPPKVAAVLRRATASQAADRYPDAAAFGAALDRATRSWVPGRVWSRYHTAGRRWRALAGVAALGLCVAVTLAAAGPPAPRAPRAPGERTTGTDATGRITVILPDGWRVKGSGAVRADGGRDPALVMAPDPARWRSDPTMPGAFVGLSNDATATTAALFVSQRQHWSCAPSPVRTSRQTNGDWVVAEFTGCRPGKPVIIEAATVRPGGVGVVFVQLSMLARGDPDLVDAVLAGVSVRA
jgi:eukaryotic-like serine/threonine-protein kinase